jgi:hypothetical protein
LLFLIIFSFLSINVSASDNYSKDELFKIKILLCESYGYNDDLWGDYNKKTGKYEAYGIAQWHEKTFNDLKVQAGWSWMKWKNREHQIKLFNWAIDHGYGKSLWTCYTTVKERDKRMENDIKALKQKNEKEKLKKTKTKKIIKKKKIVTKKKEIKEENKLDENMVITPEKEIFNENKDQDNQIKNIEKEIKKDE